MRSGDTRETRGAADGADAAAPSTSRSRSTPATWVKVAASRAPAKWITVTLTVLFLAATAAFGGLADAPVAAAKPLPTLAPGDVHENAQFAIRVDRAVLIDELRGSGTFPEEGERVLAVTVTMTNVTNEPLLSSQFADETFLVEGLPEERPDDLGEVEMSIARLDDSTSSPWLQPDIPVDVVLTWPVAVDLLQQGDTLRVTLADFTRYEWQVLGASENAHSWIDPAPAAHVGLPVEDVGAGAEEGAG